MIELNKIQTQLTPELVESLDKEVYSELWEFINSVPFIYNLVSENRPRIKDLDRWDFPNLFEDRKKDKKGRVYVDLENPHILEDMDYFRPAALHYEKHQRYTLANPNSHPKSEYYLFWKEETRRCREGYMRESDGEWITGDFYFYLNYSPILQTEDVPGTKRVNRVYKFPKFWDGDYFYYHYIKQAWDNSQHGICLKTRGRGYSFKGGSDSGKLFILGESEQVKEKCNGFVIAELKEYLIKDGFLSKFLDVLDWNAENTPWPRTRLVDKKSDLQWQMGEKNPYTGIVEGTKNQIMGVTLQGDKEKARGKRGVKIWWEEFGKNSVFLEAWNIARPSVERDGKAFGLMIGFGTGGTDEADFRGAQEIYYSPSGYNVYGLKNVYDKNVKGNQECAFFSPVYLNYEGFYNENGNSDVVGALIEVLKERVKVYKKAKDPHTILQLKAENPIVPQEAILRKEGSLFPVLELKDYLSEIEPSLDNFVSSHYTGKLYLNNSGNIDWRIDNSIRPLREYNLKRDEDRRGCVEIFEMPVSVGQSSKPEYGLYIAGIDPIDYDESTQSGSLFSMFVMNSMTKRIVAEYTGRHTSADENYRTCLFLLKYYNAIANYENNLKGLYAYFKHKNALSHLCDTPEILRDKNVTFASSGNTSKGTPANKTVNIWARKLLADWMLEEATSNQTDDEGVPIYTTNLRRVRSIGLIKEAIAWNPDGNFDRISAMGMLMILLKDREQISFNQSNREYDKTNKQMREALNNMMYKQNFSKKLLFR